MSVNYRVVNASPDDVFGVLADGWSYAAWVVGTSRIRAVGSSWPRAGSAIHHSFGLWPLVIDDVTTVDLWDAPRTAIMHAQGGPLGRTRIRFDVQVNRHGTVIRLIEDVVSGPALPVPRVVRDAVGRVRNRETLRRLAFLAEGAMTGEEADGGSTD